jgi:hypothetical protein
LKKDVPPAETEVQPVEEMALLETA